MAKGKKDPTKIHLNEVNFDSKAFFQRLGDALISAADTDFGTATTKILGIAKNETLEHKTLELILTALETACRGILQDEDEHQKMLDAIPNLSAKAKKLNLEITSKLKDLELSVDQSFFTAPHKTTFIKQLQPLYQEWLHAQIGFTIAHSKSLASLLPLKFLDKLARLWSLDPDAYKEIENFFQNPFFRTIEQESQKISYYSHLQSFYSQPVFGSAEMTLADIYVAPYFQVYKKCFPKEELEVPEEDSDGFHKPKFKGSLHQYILNLFKGKSPLDLNAEKSNFTILLGQPGQGKTSFCLRSIYDLLSEDQLADQNLYFVRLRQIINIKDIIHNPLESIRKHIAKAAFKADEAIPLKDLENAILILDGLDELYMHQGLSNSDIKNLVTNLSNELHHLKGLKLLLTTRYNYLNIDDLSGEKYLILKIEELSLKQQLDWLKKYKAIYKKCTLTKTILKTIHKSDETKYTGIKELINQPILLQMIARSGLDIKNGSNRAKIYETLFDNIIHRKWSADGQLEKYQKLTKKDLRNFLQTIALSIFHSEFEYIRRNEFKSKELLCKAKDQFLKKTENKLSLDDALKDILVSFYFKNKKKDPTDHQDDDRHDDYAIEFLHKSLQEYLVAEKIWIFFKNTFTRKDTDEEYIIEDWKTALEKIYPIVSPKMLSTEIVDYLIEIIKNDPSISEKEELTARLESFLPQLIKRDFLYQFDVAKEVLPFNQALSTFYAYWTVLSHLREENIIHETSKERFIFLLKSLIELPFVLRINLVGINLEGANMYGALLNVNLSRANLEGANMYGANLIGANLYGVNLYGANLSRAHLNGAHLNRANLIGAYLYEANLSRAHLNGAHLNRANLIGVNLNGAYLKGAYLYGAYLNGANLIGVQGLKIHQLLQAKSLKDCLGLSKEIEASLREQKPSLFE